MLQQLHKYNLHSKTDLEESSARNKSPYIYGDLFLAELSIGYLFIIELSTGWFLCS